MTEPDTTTVEINGFSCRVWQKGSGPKLGFLAGFGGLPRWIPFLDALAEERTVIVPSLPGFPGGERGHTVLDTHLDWVLATRQLVRKAGLDGADLVGSSAGGSLAAEIAAIWPLGQAAGADRAVRPVRREGPDDRPLGPARPRRAGAAVRRSGALGGAEGRARGPELAGMADRAGARRRGRRPHLLAARQHQARKAPAADRGADPAAVGRTGPHHAARATPTNSRAASRARPRSGSSPAPATSPNSTSPTRSPPQSSNGCAEPLERD